MNSKKIKYITNPLVLSFYEQTKVKDAISYFENVVRTKIEDKRKGDEELNKVLLESAKIRKPVCPIIYDNMYDDYMNYARFILEKTDSIEELTLLTGDLDLAVNIIAAYIRNRMMRVVI